MFRCFGCNVEFAERILQNKPHWYLERSRSINCPFVGTKKPHEDKLLGPDTFQWSGGLPCEGVEVKKFGMSLEFLAGYPGKMVVISRKFGAPETSENNTFVFNSLASTYLDSPAILEQYLEVF